MNENDRHFNNPRRANDELYQDIAGMPGFSGIEQEQKISDMRARNHGESQAEQMERDRRVYANNPAPYTFGATTVNPATAPRMDSFNPQGYGNEPFDQTRGESYVARFNRHQAEKSLVNRIKNFASNFKSTISTVPAFTISLVPLLSAAFTVTLVKLAVALFAL